jgi:hypothetical protein
MGTSFKPSWREYIGVHEELSALEEASFLMYDNDRWWCHHPSRMRGVVDTSPLTVPRILGAIYDNQPRIVHFGTHGLEDGRFCIQYNSQNEPSLFLAASDVHSWNGHLRGVAEF